MQQQSTPKRGALYRICGREGAFARCVVTHAGAVDAQLRNSHRVRNCFPYTCGWGRAQGRERRSFARRKKRFVLITGGYFPSGLSHYPQPLPQLSLDDTRQRFSEKAPMWYGRGMRRRGGLCIRSEIVRLGTQLTREAIRIAAARASRLRRSTRSGSGGV